MADAAVSSFASVKQAVLTNAPQVYSGGDWVKSHEEQTALARTFTRAMHGRSMGPELSAVLTEAGFTDIDVQPTFGYWSIVTGRKP
jgi:hypothetical protein